MIILKTKYILVKKNNFKKYSNLNLNNSYDVKKKKDRECLGIIKIYDKKLITRAIKKNFDNRFKKILELMIKIDEEDDSGEGYLLLLDETDKFKKELMSKYRDFLRKEQLDFLNRKIELLEKEMKNKLLAIEMIRYSLNRISIIGEI